MMNDLDFLNRVHSILLRLRLAESHHGQRRLRLAEPRLEAALGIGKALPLELNVLQD